MSAAGSARLALVPADAEAPPPPPFDALVRSSAAKAALAARTRRVMAGIWTAGCALLVTGPLLAYATGDASLGGMVLAGAFLLPMSGLALFCLALYEHSRDAVTTLVAAVVTFACAVALIGPANRAAVEMYVAANQAELDAVAEEIGSLAAANPPNGDRTGRLGRLIGENFNVRLRRVGITAATPIDGGLLFTSDVGMEYTLFYAGGGAGPPDTCGMRQMRFIGGRWFEARCREYDND